MEIQSEYLLCENVTGNSSSCIIILEFVSAQMDYLTFNNIYNEKGTKGALTFDLSSSIVSIVNVNEAAFNNINSTIG